MSDDMLSELKKAVAAARKVESDGMSYNEFCEAADKAMELASNLVLKHGDALIVAVELAEADYQQSVIARKERPQRNFADVTRELNAARDAYRAAKGESDE